MRKISYNDELILRRYYKFEEKVKEKIKSDIKKGIDKHNLLKSIKAIKKKPLSPKVLELFYEEPTKFFEDYKQLLEKTSLFDSAGISIFMHYFYVLYNYRHKIRFKRNVNFEIYENNFDSFFKEEGKYLSIQDFSLETPLHKLAKLKNKQFFLEICQKLKQINILNEELLSIKDINDLNCYNYIVDEVEVNRNEIIQNDFDIYNHFINYYPSLLNTLSKNSKKNIILFSSKIGIDIEKLKEKDFENTYKKIYSLLEKNDENFNIVECLYYPETSNINYLNYLFHICEMGDDYEQLIKLISLLLKNNNTENKKSFSEICVLDHITYVMKKMNSSKSKGNIEIKYSIQLLKEILPIILKDKNDMGIQKILSDKIIYKKKIKLVKKGLINNLINNNNLDFEKKDEILTIFFQILIL